MLLLGRVCRTCLLKSPTMHRLIDPKRDSMQIEDMLHSTVSNFDLYLELKKDTPLPVEICSECLKKLQVSYDFQKLCIASNERLRKFFASNEAKEENLSDHSVLSCENGINLPELIKVEDNNEDPLPCATVRDDCRDLETNKEKLTSEVACLPLKCEEERPKETEVTETEQQFDKEIKSECNEDHSPWNSESNEPFETEDDSDYSKSDLPKISSNKICPDCRKVFKKRMYLTRHLSVHSLDNKYVCDICQYRYATAKLLTLHKSRQHSDFIINVEGGPYQCPDCPMIFDQTRALAAHKVKHLARDFNCEICGVYLKTLGAITRHMNCKHPGILPYKCEMCDKAFPVKTHYRDHLQLHEGYKKYKCEMCDKSFPNTTALKDHIRTHTGESPYLCSHCGKSFKTTNILRQHLLRHGERNFQCPQCPARFFGPSNLRQHMYTHSREKPHVCDICGSAFSRRDSLKAHKFKHSGERPFKCDQCNLRFAFKSYLMRHKVRHTGQKPHKCSHCDRAYASSGDLVKHLRTHVGENTYFCDVCPQNFRYQHDLRDHKNEHYNEKRLAANGEDGQKTKA